MLTRLIIGLLLSISIVAQSATASADDVDEISKVVQKYFDGTAQGKPELVAEAFLPSLDLQYIDRVGAFSRISGPDYIARIQAGKKVDRIGKIVYIDSTDTAAVVKAEVDWGERLFTDYLLLLKVAGEWRISNKIATNRLK